VPRPVGGPGRHPRQPVGPLGRPAVTRDVVARVLRPLRGRLPLRLQPAQVRRPQRRLALLPAHRLVQSLGPCWAEDVVASAGARSSGYALIVVKKRPGSTQQGAAGPLVEVGPRVRASRPRNLSSSSSATDANPIKPVGRARLVFLPISPSLLDLLSTMAAAGGRK
jgi:hypothetical protein